MRPDDIRHWLRRVPFRLFVLENTTYDIRHPEHVAVGRSTITVNLPTPNLPIPLGERFVVIALLHITKLEPLPLGGSVSGNGR